MCRTTLLACGIASVCLGASALAADHWLGFDWCPSDPVLVQPGEERIEVWATLDTDLADSARVRAWSVGLVVDGAEILADETFGDPQADPPRPGGLNLTVPLVRDDDGDPGTAPVDAGAVDLRDLGTIEPAQVPSDPTVRGLVSRVSLDEPGGVTLGAGDRVPIFRAVLAVVPGRRVRLRFQDGLVGSDEPIANSVETVIGRATPALGGCDLDIALDTREFRLSVAPEPWAVLPGVEGEFAVLERSLPAGRHRIPCLLELASGGLLGADGPQGWSVSVRHDPGLWLESTGKGAQCPDLHGDPFSGVVVSTVFDHDGNPETPDLYAHPFDMGACDFKTARPAEGTSCSAGTGDPAPGLIAAVVMNFTRKLALVANSRQAVARVTYTVDVRPGPNPDLRIWYEDGLAVPGCSCPVDNAITYRGETFYPAGSRGLLLRLTGLGDWPGDPYARGDANEDGRIDLSDAVTILGFLFAHQPESLACRKAADADDGGTIDITDPIYLLNHEFLGGPPPRDPYPWCGHDHATPDGLTCESFSACP